MRSRAEAAPSYVFVPDLGELGSRIDLSDGESHYLTRVCRARIGDLATATDGKGGLAKLRLVSLEPKVSGEVENLVHSRPQRRAWVWSGAPEGERADWLVEKLAELGVERWQPLHCERAGWERGATRTERWQRLALAGMRQSQRTVLLEIRDPVGIPEAMAELPAEGARWLASAGAPRHRPLPEPGLAIGAIGPSGGFTPAEQTGLEGAGFTPISLADGRLRSETASLAWAFWWAIG